MIKEPSLYVSLAVHREQIAELEAENKRLREALEAFDNMRGSSNATYHVMFRPEGSISVYLTRNDKPGHYVFYDSLDAPRA
jgi:hypothetical protein